MSKLVLSSVSGSWALNPVGNFNAPVIPLNSQHLHTVIPQQELKLLRLYQLLLSDLAVEDQLIERFYLQKFLRQRPEVYLE